MPEQKKVSPKIIKYSFVKVLSLVLLGVVLPASVFLANTDLRLFSDAAEFINSLVNSPGRVYQPSNIHAFPLTVSWQKGSNVASYNVSVAKYAGGTLASRTFLPDEPATWTIKLSDVPIDLITDYMPALFTVQTNFTDGNIFIDNASFKIYNTDQPIVKVISPPNGSIVSREFDVALNLNKDFIAKKVIYSIHNGPTIVSEFNGDPTFKTHVSLYGIPWINYFKDGSAINVSAVAEMELAGMQLFKESTTLAHTLTLEDGDFVVPTVQFISPTTGDVSGKVEIKAKAITNDPVTKLEIRINGDIVKECQAKTECTYLWDTTKVADLKYILYTEVEVSSGSKNYANMEVKVVNGADNMPPELILHPAQGAIVKGTASFYADISDNLNVIRQTIIYYDGEVLTSCTTKNICGVFNLNTVGQPRFADGVHTLKAVSLDLANNEAVKEVRFTIANSNVPTITPTPTLIPTLIPTPIPTTVITPTPTSIPTQSKIPSVLNSPANGAVVTFPVNFSWSVGNGIRTVSGYRLSLGSQNGSGNMFDDSFSTTNVTISSGDLLTQPSSDQQIYIQLRSYFNDGTWHDNKYSIKNSTITEEPDVGLVQPTNNSTVSFPLNFKWKEEANVRYFGYRLALSSQDGGADIYDESFNQTNNVTLNLSDLQKSLSNGQKIYVKFRVTYNNGSKVDHDYILNYSNGNVMGTSTDKSPNIFMKILQYLF